MVTTGSVKAHNKIAALRHDCTKGSPFHPVPAGLPNEHRCVPGRLLWHANVLECGTSKLAGVDLVLCTEVLHAELFDLLLRQSIACWHDIFRVLIIQSLQSLY